MSLQQQLLRDEARAWREIAERIASRGLRGHGLCWEVALIGGLFNDEPEPVGVDVETTMGRRISGHLPIGAANSIDRVVPETPGRGLGCDELRADIRVLGALLLALEAEDELKALSSVSRPSSLRRPRQHRRGK